MASREDGVLAPPAYTTSPFRAFVSASKCSLNSAGKRPARTVPSHATATSRSKTVIGGAHEEFAMSTTAGVSLRRSRSAKICSNFPLSTRKHLNDTSSAFRATALITSSLPTIRRTCVPWAAGSWTTGLPHGPVALGSQEGGGAPLLEAAPPLSALPSPVRADSASASVRVERVTRAKSSPSASACGLLLYSQQGSIKWPDGA